ncbi:hypothetical protein JR334_11680 [Clostridia bacterium]|nr:hypothetical protein JR334_11680 [Clostridia bacterium]
MDKIVVLVLTIAVTIGLFSFSVLGEAANARDMMSYVEQEQNEVQFLMNNPNVVTAQYAYDYYNKYNGQYTIVFFDKEEVEILTTSVQDYNFFNIEKTYGDSGEITKVTFKEYEA